MSTQGVRRKGRANSTWRRPRPAGRVLEPSRRSDIACCRRDHDLSRRTLLSRPSGSSPRSSAWRSSGDGSARPEQDKIMATSGRTWAGPQLPADLRQQLGQCGGLRNNPWVHDPRSPSWIMCPALAQRVPAPRLRPRGGLKVLRDSRALLLLAAFSSPAAKAREDRLGWPAGRERLALLGNCSGGLSGTGSVAAAGRPCGRPGTRQPCRTPPAVGANPRVHPPSWPWSTLGFPPRTLQFV